MGNKQTIIGISPGTSLLGFSVFRGNVLVDYGIKSYSGKWSKRKLRHITASIEKLIAQYAPQTVVMMVADIESSSENVEQLNAEVESLLERKKLKLFKCALQDIMRICCYGTVTVKEFHDCIMGQYPELAFIESHRLNWHIYYSKLFEAMGAIQWHFTEL